MNYLSPGDVANVSAAPSYEGPGGLLNAAADAAAAAANTQGGVALAGMLALVAGTLAVGVVAAYVLRKD